MSLSVMLILSELYCVPQGLYCFPKGSLDVQRDSIDSLWMLMILFRASIDFLLGGLPPLLNILAPALGISIKVIYDCELLYDPQYVA